MGADPWQRSFCRLYRTPHPVVRLGQIMHWSAVTNGFGLSDPVEQHPALVADGYFYRPHTPPPGQGTIETELARGATHGARWLLYPVVREHNAADLADQGFTGLPWFLEAEFEVERDVDHDLRVLLGGARLRGLLRLVRRAAESFDWEVAAGAAVDAAVLASFDRLHRLNLARYGHTHNHFSAPILADLAASPLGARLCVFRHRHRAGGQPAQAVLALHHPDSGELELLVQGIDHASVERGHNLYAAALYRIYRWGAARGVHRFNLGRGAQLTKLNLGANRFHLVSNQLAPIGGARAGLGPLRRAARAALEPAVAELRTAVERRGTSRYTALPAGGRTA